MEMSYESPIKVIEKDLMTKMEDDIIYIVKSYGIEVDKEELLKALKYDRKQYDRGYTDGQRDERDGRTAKVEVVEKPNVFKCSECGQYFHSTAWGSPVNYCSRCGARLEWDE